jgi:hypothetical protein
VSDRLSELRRQRALAQEQLAWFDREIARESGQTVIPAAPAASSQPSSPVIPMAAPINPVSDAATAHMADQIIARYQQNPQSAAKDVKKGCYLWFFFGLAVLALCAAAIYALYGEPPPQ